jgi:GH24 family phage-related lysozyme (muramidase)
MRSSQAAVDLIIREEDNGAAYYERFFTHFEWPEGASGPTIGIGYDLGYVTFAQASAGWQGIVPPETIAAMQPACGLRGQAAHAFVQEHGASITIHWDQAMSQFTKVELPKWETSLFNALPNTDGLSADSFGALVSLIFNRGTGGFHDPSPRDIEMRNIYAHMAAKEFNKIPMEFLAMRRLWPVGKDLWNRRTHEAALFVRGLSAPAVAVA